MGFDEVKRLVLEALRTGKIQHDFRTGESKNLLASGLVDPFVAMDLIGRTRGHEAHESPHHADASVQVWVLRPRGWYIKVYYRKDWRFVSFHREGEQ